MRARMVSRTLAGRRIGPGWLAWIDVVFLHTEILLDRPASIRALAFPLSRILISCVVSITLSRHKNIAKQEKWATLLHLNKCIYTWAKTLL